MESGLGNYGLFGVVAGVGDVEVTGALAAPSIELTGSPERGTNMYIKIRPMITTAATMLTIDVLDWSRKPPVLRITLSSSGIAM